MEKLELVVVAVLVGGGFDGSSGCKAKTFRFVFCFLSNSDIYQRSCYL